MWVHSSHTVYAGGWCVAPDTLHEGSIRRFEANCALVRSMIDIMVHQGGTAPSCRCIGVAHDLEYGVGASA